MRSILGSAPGPYPAIHFSSSVFGHQLAGDVMGDGEVYHWGVECGVICHARALSGKVAFAFYTIRKASNRHGSE